MVPTCHPSFPESINGRISVRPYLKKKLKQKGLRVWLEWECHAFKPQYCQNPKNKEPVLVAHAGNPSYLGGRDQEDRGSKPAQANSSQDPISKKPITKKGWWSGSRCRP
jgi:hypothetical protein